ncbi:MAG: serine/threonine-protein kinase [Polyangiaceae bacterium]
MKSCTTCQRLYPDDGGFCPIDGQKLQPVEEVPVPSDPKDPRVGATFCAGRYQIRRIVADGGMGRVYQALDMRENRSVAMKILHQDVATDSVARTRFAREAELSASLPHAHIVETLAFEKTEDQSYALVMEYLEGEELRMLLKRDKTLPAERVVRMLSQIGVGLGPAHERKVVHRDLKPDNVFLCGTSDGDVVKLLDFGSVRDNSEGAKKLTVMGTTIGSPFYMAPEQAQGLATLDHRADVWSLAAIAYECLTGAVPFQGNTGPAILLAILTRDPAPPSEVAKERGLDLPKALDEVMEEALTKDPTIRIATAAALADRMGAAFGLSGHHGEWANVPQAELGERIETAKAQAAAAPPAAPVEVAPAFQQEPYDAFKAGSAGGPAGLSPFAEDEVGMGVPQARPRWLIPAIAAACVVVGAIVTLLVAR